MKWNKRKKIDFGLLSIKKANLCSWLL